MTLMEVELNFFHWSFTLSNSKTGGFEGPVIYFYFLFFIFYFYFFIFYFLFFIFYFLFFIFYFLFFIFYFLFFIFYFLFLIFYFLFFVTLFSLLLSRQLLVCLSIFLSAPENSWVLFFALDAQHCWSQQFTSSLKKNLRDKPSSSSQIRLWRNWA